MTAEFAEVRIDLIRWRVDHLHSQVQTQQGADNLLKFLDFVRGQMQRPERREWPTPAFRWWQDNMARAAIRERRP